MTADARREINDAPVDGTFQPPLSVTRPELLRDGSDAAFREVIWDLLIVANRLQKFPEAFGRELGITGAQYAVLIATAHIQGTRGSGIRQLADYMHLPAPHVTTTVGRLVAAGLLAKKPNPEDGRGVLISLTPEGEAALDRLAPFQQQVNDALFGGLSRDQFDSFARLIGTMVGNSRRALKTVAELQQDDDTSPRAAAE
jgi:MarR family transcriptional regulator, organic hydroperoxide resistance regulator